MANLQLLNKIIVIKYYLESSDETKEIFSSASFFYTNFIWH